MLMRKAIQSLTHRAILPAILPAILTPGSACSTPDVCGIPQGERCE
ncbi:hypothetical protein [Citrobacter amalonaticus]|nr:hypothetical protein [Citrobacter amalonaticus]